MANPRIKEFHVGGASPPILPKGGGPKTDIGTETGPKPPPFGRIGGVASPARSGGGVVAIRNRGCGSQQLLRHFVLVRQLLQFFRRAAVLGRFPISVFLLDRFWVRFFSDGPDCNRYVRYLIRSVAGLASKTRRQGDGFSIVRAYGR